MNIDRAGRTDAPDLDSSTANDHATDLTAFQRDILAILADHPDYGMGVKRSIESYYGEEVNHGRLYPNLDDLVELGLVEKSELDKRTNQYEITEQGRKLLRSHALWMIENVDAGGYPPSSTGGEA